MRVNIVIAALVIVTTSFAPRHSMAQKRSSQDNIEEIIRQLHLEGVHAQLTNNIATLDRLWSDDHTFTNPLGVVQTKAERLAEIKSGARKLESFNIDDIQVRVYDNTAVVTGRGTLKGQLRGNDLSIQARGIDVYVKKEGAWQLVAAQATRIVQP
jgi:Domain of unknown function (DUF4440)